VLISALKWCSTSRTRDGRHPPAARSGAGDPPAGQAPKRERWLTLEEETRLLAAAPAGGDRLSRIQPLYGLAVDDGARCEAIEELTGFRSTSKPGRWTTGSPAAPAAQQAPGQGRMTARSRAMLQRAAEERTGAFVLDHAGPIIWASRPRCSGRSRRGAGRVTPLCGHWHRAIQNGVPPQEVADQLADDIATHYENYTPVAEYMKEAARGEKGRREASNESETLKRPSRRKT